MFFSASTGGFYDPEIHGDSIPADAVEVSNAEYAALFLGQSEGKRIVAGHDGFPVLADPPPPSPKDLIRAQIQVLESQQTDRRIREAVLGVDKGWLKNIESEIAALRSQLS